MRRLLLVPALAALAIPAAAQAPDWRDIPRIELRIGGSRYYPATVQLAAGEPIVLRVTNLSDDTHVISARQFFDAAVVRPEDRSVVAGGAIDLEGRESRELALVPAAGRYELTCSQQWHEMMGEKAEIIVQ